MGLNLDVKFIGDVLISLYAGPSVRAWLEGWGLGHTIRLNSSLSPEVISLTWSENSSIHSRCDMDSAAEGAEPSPKKSLITRTAGIAACLSRLDFRNILPNGVFIFFKNLSQNLCFVVYWHFGSLDLPIISLML